MRGETPLGVKVLSTLIALEGVLILVAGVIILIAGLLFCVIALVAVLVLAIGAGLVYLGKGLWDLESWAWLWTIILQLLGLPIILWSVFSDPGGIFSTAQIVIWLVIICYLWFVKGEFDDVRSPTIYESRIAKDNMKDLLPAREPIRTITPLKSVEPGKPYCPGCRSGSEKMKIFLDGSGYCEACGKPFHDEASLPRG